MQIPSIFYFSVVNFVIFVAVLYFVLRRPARDFFSDRAAHLQKALAEADAVSQAANDRLRAIQQRMEQVEKEIAALQRRFQEEGALEQHAAVERAQAFAAKSAHDTKRMIQQELRRVHTHLRKTTVDVAIVMAERILREQTTPDDQSRLARAYIQKLGALH